MTFILGCFLATLAFSSIVIKRAYESVSIKELKKKARKGDQIAALLHQSAAYGPSLHFILWSLVCITSALFFVFVSRSTDAWFAAFLCVGLLWFGFIWLPARNVSALSVWVAARLSPVLSRLASILYPVVQFVTKRTQSLFPVHFHTGLYDESDIVQLLEKQKAQKDNQISDSALEIASHAITYADVLVRDILVPRRAVRVVQEDETTGPIFLNELHESGFSRFPVYGEKQNDIVGILFLRDLVKSKHSGKVKTVMSKEVFYIHEDQTLKEALAAILKTHQHLFIVVNSFEEYVGILTSEDVFERILGHQIIDEADSHEDMRAVAASAAKADHEQLAHPIPEASEDEE